MAEFNPQDRKHLVNLSGQQYITVVGLQARMADQGKSIVGSHTEIYRDPYDNEDKAAVVNVSLMIQMEGKTFGPISAVGDASVRNVNTKLAEATLRMAETRAFGRALRIATRSPYTALEELPSVKEAEDTRVA